MQALYKRRSLFVKQYRTHMSDESGWEYTGYQDGGRVEHQMMH